MRTPLCKFTMCDDTTLSSPIPAYPTMKINQIYNCLSADLQSNIAPPMITIIKVELEEERLRNIIKVNKRRKLDSATYDTYKLKMVTFENYQPEEFLALLNNFRIEINGTGTTSVSGRIKYIRTMLHVESLREFDELAS